MMGRCLVAAIALAVSMTLSGVGHGANCCVDGACIFVGNLTTGSAPLATLCGHTISGVGSGVCTITMGQDESIASGSCVNLGDKTTLNMSHHTISCTGAACDTALNLNAGSSAGGIVGTGSILGCWSNAAYVQFSGTNPTITDVNVDLASLGSPCTNTTNGLGGFLTITRVVVGHATGIGIQGHSKGSVKNSIVHHSGLGILVAGFSPTVGTKITDSLVADNDVSIRTASTVTSGGGPSRLEDSAVRNAGTCHFVNFSGVCSSSAEVVELRGTDFIDDMIFLSGVQVVP